MSNFINSFDHNIDQFKDNDIQELDRNSSLVYIENIETEETDWVDFRDVDRWEC